MAGNGSVLSLKGYGPQDESVASATKFAGEMPSTHYSDFSIDQVIVPFGVAPFFGTIQSLTIDPQTFQGDLISNMHLVLNLPSLPLGNSYATNIARNIIKSFTLFIDGQDVETITSDWLSVRDDIFLDDDEKTGISFLINGGFSISDDSFKQTYSQNPTTLEIIIPIEFFFSRRYSPYLSLIHI